MPPGGENERAFSIRLSTTWPRRESCPGTWNARDAAAFEAQRHLHAVVALDLVGDADQRVEQLGEIDRRGLLALQLGIEPAGVGNSEIRRSSRCTSCWMMLRSRARLSSVLATGSVSTAERSDVSGFLSSCATSAAKLSIASIRL